MAKTVTTTVTDDLDGSTNAQEINFSYQGIAYTIDLGKKNAAALDKLLKPYVTAATKVPTSARAAAAVGRGRRAVASTGRKDVSAIREWAAANGHSVNARGRIPSNVLEAYNTAKK